METQVKTYKTRGSMESGIADMTAKGFRVASQSGELSANLWTTGIGKRQKVVVTFVKDDVKSTAESGSDEDRVNAAIVLLVKSGYTVTPPSAAP